MKRFGNRKVIVGTFGVALGIVFVVQVISY